MRHVCPPVAGLLAMMLCASAHQALGQGASASLAINNNYTFVGQARYTVSQWYVTYRAELMNSGPAVSSAVARVKSASPNIVIVPGQDTVHFGPIPANATGISIDAFTIIVNRSVAFSWSDLRWEIDAPVANAGPSQTVGTGRMVFLNGAGSTNPDPDPLSYQWTLSSVPEGSRAALSNPTSVIPSFIADVVGQYGLNLTVSNGSATDSATTTISTSGSLPVASAGPNQSVPLHSTVTLDGSGSYDINGEPLTYLWTLISLPTGSDATLGSDYSSVEPTFTADVAGTYVAQLVVTDHNGTSAPSTVTISTGNTAPVANAGPNQAVQAGSTVRLDGAGSTDVNGNALSYKWSLLSVPARSAAMLSDATAVNPTFTADLNGTYVAQLIVNDGKVDSTPSTVIVTTNTILAPTANAGSDQAANVNSNVTLSGSGSDPQGLPLSYSWSLLSRPASSVATLLNPSTQRPTLFIDFPGIYVVQLITNNGDESSVPSTVVVTTGSTAPIAVVGPTQNVAAGTLVTLNGTASYDPNFNPLTYTWSLLHVPQGSNAMLSTSNVAAPTFVADLPGTYIAQLIVSNGVRDSAPVTVIINASEMKISLSPNALNLLLNAPGSLTVNVTPPAGPHGLVVNFSNFNPAILSMPSNVNIPANASSATVTVDPLAIGSTGVLASASGYISGTTTVNVGSANISITLPSGVGVGHSASGTVTLSAPAPAGGTVVTLTSNVPGTATVAPSPVTIPSGSTTASFTVTGVNPGSAKITASATGYTSGTANILVSILGAIGLAPNVAVAPGHSAPLTVTLSSPAPLGGETVTLRSSDTTKVTVTSEVIIPQGATTPATQPQVTGVAFGSATITATGPGYANGSQLVQVTATLTFSPSTANIGAGGTQTLALNLSSASTSPIVVNLTSSNTSVATVPPSVTIAANATSVPVTVTGKAAGSARITASATTPGIASGTASINVASFGGIIAPATLSVGLGQSVSFPVSLSSPAPQNGVTVTLSSSNPAIASISPGAVTIAAGQTQPATQPQITATGVGSATITASAPGYVSSSTIAHTTASLRLAPQNVSIIGAGNQTLTVFLSGPAPTGGVVVNLSASPTDVISIPSSVTIPANSSSVTFSVTGVSSGRATLTASTSQPGVTSATTNITVQSGGTITLPTNVSVGLGHSAPFQITLSAPAPTGGVTVTLASSHPGIVSVSPSSVTIAGGATHPATVPQVSGVAPGNAAITASSPTYTSASQNVSVTATIGLTPQSPSVAINQTQSLTLTLSGPAPTGGITFNVSSSNTSVATVASSSITIGTGSTTAMISARGVGVGTAVVTATAPNIPSATDTITVTSSGIIVPGTLTVAPGQTVTFPVTLASPPSSNVSVTLTTSNSHASLNFTNVSFNAGSTTPTRQPTLTGNTAGQVTITASAPNLGTATSVVTVGASATLTPNPLTITPTESGTLTISLSAPATTTTTFTLSSSNQAVATVPGTVRLGAGQQSVGFAITPVGIGSTTITASATGLSPATAQVNVRSALPLTLSASTTSLQLGGTATLTVSLPAASQTGAVMVNLTSSSSSVSISPTFVTIPQGSLSATARLTGINVGSATISASATGYGASNGLSIQVGATISWSKATLTLVGNGQQGFLSLTLSGSVPGASGSVPITLSSGNTAVATVPGSVTFTPNGGTNPTIQIPVTSVSPGTATIHASGTNIPNVDATVTVVGPLTISTTSLASGSVGLSYTATIHATGGIPPYTYAATGLPANLAINSSAGQITGIPQSAGSNTVNVTVKDSSSPTPATARATYTLVISQAAPASITATSGTPQTALTGAAFALPLVATVKDTHGNPLGGVSVTFTAPSSGASGKFSGNSLTNVVNTNASGQATSSTFTANSTSGSYAVTATVSGVSTAATFSLTNSTRPPGSITATSGTPQTVLVNTAFAALVATVKDSSGNPVAGASVTFTAPASGASGSFAGGSKTATVTTNSSGVATAPTYTANTTAGSYTVTATVAGVSAPASFSLTNSHGPAATISATAGTPQTAAVRTAFAAPLSATVKDSFGNLVGGVTVTFTAPATGASGTFSTGTNTITATTNSSGVASSGTFTANATSGGPYSVNARVTGVTNPAVFALTNSAGAPGSITATGGTPQSAVVNAAFATALSATVKDANNNPVSGATVTFTAPASGASGTFAGGVTTHTATTNASGVASLAFTANTVAGTYTVTATAAGVSGSASFSLTNRPGAAHSIALTSGSGQSAQINRAFASPLVVKVTDAFGNAVSGASVTYTAPASGASGTFPSNVKTNTVTTNASGVATSATFTANGTTGAYSVQASVPGASNTVAFSLTNVSGSAASITATSGTPQNAVVRTAFAQALVATVKDSSGNPVAGASVVFSAPGSGASGTFSNGSTTITVTANSSGVATSGTFTANGTAGSYNVTATTAGVASSAPFALKNLPGAVSSVTIGSGSNQSARINTAFASPLTVVVKDANGNTISGVTVTFTPPSSGPGGTFAGGVNTAVTNSTGTATAAIFTANASVGTYSVKAAVQSVSANFALTNTPGPVANLAAVSGSGQTTTVNVAFTNPLKVVAKDSAGNLVPGATVTFTAPASGASGTWPGGGNVVSAITDGTGTATSPTLTANSKAGSYSVTASVGSVSTTFTLTNTHGAAAAIAASAGSNQSAAIGTAFATQLQATVTDSHSNPVSGVQVTFSAPATGASGTFSGASTTATVTTNASGVATAPVFTANNTQGGYSVAAFLASNTTITTSFSLTNRSGNPQTVAVFSGSGQSAATNAAFANPLQAIVTDAGGNALRGISVTFTAPTGAAPGGTFTGGSNTATVTTASNGVATAPTFTANTTTGTYTVVASVQGLASTAAFHLTNTQGPCNGCGTITVASATVGKNLETSITVTLTPPAPATGLYLSYSSSNAAALLVGSSATLAGSGSFVPNPNGNPNIPPGTRSFSIEVQALAASGTPTVNVSASGYNTGTGTITLVPSGFVLAGTNGVGGSFNAFEGSSTTLTVYSGPLNSAGAFAGDQAVRGGFSIAVPVSSSNTSVGTVSPASVTLASNPTNGAQSSSTTSFKAGTTTGSTTLSITTPSGFTAPNSGASLSASVQQAGIVPFTATVGQGLELQQNIKLSGPAASATPITITSSNQTVKFACNPGEATTICTTPTEGSSQSITVTIGQGFTQSPIFLIEASGSSGTVSYTASSPGFTTVDGSVTLARAGLAIQSPGGFGSSGFTANPQSGTATLTVYTGYLDGSGHFVAAQPVASGSVTITAQSSNTSVATVTSPLTISAGADNASTGLTPKTSSVTGSTTVTMSAANFASASVTATYATQAQPLLLTGDSVVADGLELPYSVSLPSTAGGNGQQVTIQSNSASLLVSATAAGAGSSTLNLTIPAQSQSIVFYVQGASTSGSGSITASASGFSSDTVSLTLAPAGIVISPSISGSHNSSGSDQLFFVWLDSTNTPQFDNSFLLAKNSLTFNVASGNSAIAAVPSSITLNPGHGPGGVPINFGTTGTTTISITQPTGFGHPNAFTSSTVSVQ